MKELFMNVKTNKKRALSKSKRPKKDFLLEEKGSVAVIVALSIIVIFSFAALVVDLGLMYFERARLVSSAEASALAGASSFPYRDDGEYEEKDYDYAIQEAKRIAELNGLKDYEIKLLPEEEEQKNEVEVRAQKTVSFSFARVMGFYEQEVTGLAAAKSVPLSGYMGVVPFGIPEDEYEDGENFTEGEQYELKVPAGDGDKGNYQPLALGGTGTNNYRENLDEGFQEMLLTGDVVDTEPGNLGNPTKQGLEERYEEDDRVLIIPIVSYPDGGRDEVEILGFANFYLEDYDEDSASGHTIFYGTFQSNVSDGRMTAGVKDYGLRGTRLVR